MKILSESSVVRECPVLPKIECFLGCIETDFFRELAKFDVGNGACGYSSTILTTLLQQMLPKNQVRLGFSAVTNPRQNDYYAPPEATKPIHHFFTEVDERLIVDGNWSQFDESVGSNVCIYDATDLPLQYIARLDRNNPDVFIDGQSPDWISARRATINDLLEFPNQSVTPGMEYFSAKKAALTAKIIDQLRAKLGISR